MGHHAGFPRSCGVTLRYNPTTRSTAHLTSYLPLRHQSLPIRRHQQSALSSRLQPVSYLCWAQDTSLAAKPQGNISGEAKVVPLKAVLSASKEDMTHTFHPTNLKRDVSALTSFMTQDLPHSARSQSNAAVPQPHQAPHWAWGCEGRCGIDQQRQPCNSLPGKQCHPRLWFATALLANTQCGQHLS